MQSYFRKTLVALAMGLILAGCSGGQMQSAVSGSASSNGGLGGNALGQGVSVPTGNGVVARVQNGLGVSALSGNFAKALAQVNTNLPKVTDPTKATGFDQVQLLVYAACSDLTTGGTPLMQSSFGVNPKATLASSETALVAAGVKMLDSYVAGLASQGPTSAQVTAALNNLVQLTAANSANTTTMAFMSVCIAANTAGTTLLGF